MNDWPGVPGYGYRVQKSDTIRIATMVHNPTDTNYPETYLEVRVEYRPATEKPEGALKNVYPAWFDVMECRSSGYELAAGKSVTAGEVPLNYTGTLLGVGGHLHDYGRELRLVNLTRKEEIARLESTLDAQGRILSMPVETFYERGGYRLNKGERVRVTSTYSNPTAKAIPDGAMGIVVGYFLPDDDAEMAGLRRMAKRGTHGEK